MKQKHVLYIPGTSNTFFFFSVFRYGKGKGRAGELAHPFTTCSSHAVDIKGGARVSPFSEKVSRGAAKPLLVRVCWVR